MKIKPTPKQLEFLDWEFGVFFHFGIRSFFPGHTDWDGKPMPASEFNPKKLDCKQWIRIAKKAGAKYAILTCKHHDGFANWPSKYSDYSVAQTDWEGGRGDVVDCFVKACRQYGLKVGLYYSPAQWGGNSQIRKSSRIRRLLHQSDFRASHKLR
jgi:alpha-L-fucosidase